MRVDYIAFTKPWIEKLKDSTQRDPILATVYQLTQQGWPHQRRHVPRMARRYWDFRDELSTDDGMLLKGLMLIILGELQEEYLSRLHEGHLSANKVQENAKQQDCSESWEALATDIFEFQGKFFLIVSCRFSSYMVVREMTGHTAEETIDKLSSIFAELSLPRTLHCDRGTNYTSSKFQDFCKGLNIKVTYSSAEHHSSNYAERGVQTVKQFMRKTEEWQMALLEYLMTPIRLQGIQNSPLQLMKKRTIRGILPVRQQGTCSGDYERKLSRRQEQAKYQSGSQYKPLAMGLSILYYDHDKSQWVPGVLVEKIHDRSYVIISQKGRKVTRNRIDIKPY